jgi:general secretion pathway protein A
MYKQFYRLKDRPFEITPDPRFLFLSRKHKEAYAHLLYAVRAGKSFTVITGEVGTGKTTLIQAFLKEMGGKVRSVHIFYPRLTPSDLLEYICKELGLNVSEARWKNLKSLNEFLLECFHKGERVLLIVDEAHTMSMELLEEIRLLTNLETVGAKLLNIILIGQPELEKVLDDVRLRQLKQRISLRYDLKPLDFNEMQEYISVRLKTAGHRGKPFFDQGALKKIYEYSAGIPRLINIVCDNSLLTGFFRETKTIGKDIIEDSIQDIDGKINGKRGWLAVVAIFIFFAAALALSLLEASDMRLFIFG